MAEIYDDSIFSGQESEWEENALQMREKSARLTNVNANNQRQRQQRFHDGNNGVVPVEAFERHRNNVIDGKYYAAYKSYQVHLPTLHNTMYSSYSDRRLCSRHRLISPQRASHCCAI